MTKGDVVSGSVEIISNKNEILLFLKERMYATGIPIIKFTNITIKESLKLSNTDLHNPASFNSFKKRWSDVWKNIPDRRSISVVKNRKEII
jgi:hypothetical protein